MKQQKLLWILAMALWAGCMTPSVDSDREVLASLVILDFMLKNPEVFEHQIGQAGQEVDSARSRIEQARKNVKERQTFVDLLIKDESKETILKMEETTRANILASLQQVLAELGNLDKVRDELDKMKIPHMGSMWNQADRDYIKDRIEDIDSVLKGTRKVLDDYYRQQLSLGEAQVFVKIEAVTVMEWIENIQRITDKKSFLEKYMEAMVGEVDSKEESEG